MLRVDFLAILLSSSLDSVAIFSFLSIDSKSSKYR